MLDLGTLRINMSVAGADKAKTQLQEVNNETKNVSSSSAKGGKSVETFGSKMRAAFSPAAIVAGAAAIVGSVKSCVSAFGDLEQSQGGAQALFKDGFDQIEQYAAKSANSVQLTSNEYYNFANSISGALSRSLDGDMDAVADAANSAITYASDAAAVLGTTTDDMMGKLVSVANGNYETLDSLTQGAFAGTKQGLEDLTKYASEGLGEALDPSNFDDVVTALQYFAEEQGFAGQAAEEASHTIQGSYATMTAA